ncbi:myeloid leukemia factor 1 isoform X3 [Peromyscus californicus insignis]|uniref:myeloid leukemia factor 1 isoform X3 n=1 Tax=Peromyscus californicus insignis TaxID=564181 RepID=UPI0022A6929A|nr:myeloid leukemia factor 1 isoform X3 [Peromyscus californicus insignis]
MFRMLSSSFEDDPFFADSFLAHRESMRHMMRSFSEPFGRNLFSISDGRGRTHNHRERDEDSSTGQLSMDPNGHSFCSSSVMTYSKVGDEPPKVFQASTQTRRAPGGIKETRRAVRDSDSGLEKMAVGHHIHDRAHVIKKSKNNKTGDEEVNQEFINMNESDAHAFDDEWQNEILKYKPSGRPHNLENNPRMRSVGYENAVPRELKKREKIHRSPAIENGRRSNIFADKLNVKGSPVKITKK